MPGRWDKDCPGDPVALAIGAFMNETAEECGHAVSPRDVNSGMCDRLADYVVDNVDGAKDVRLVDLMFPGITLESADKFEDTYPQIIHHVVEHGGKYHDAEVPCGVSIDDIKDLPVLKRFGLKGK